MKYAISVSKQKRDTKCLVVLGHSFFITCAGIARIMRNPNALQQRLWIFSAKCHCRADFSARNSEQALDFPPPIPKSRKIDGMD
jgi:hypothetical protein